MCLEYIREKIGSLKIAFPTRIKNSPVILKPHSDVLNFFNAAPCLCRRSSMQLVSGQPYNRMFAGNAFNLRESLGTVIANR